MIIPNSYFTCKQHQSLMFLLEVMEPLYTSTKVVLRKWRKAQTEKMQFVLHKMVKEYLNLDPFVFHPRYSSINTG